MKTASVNHRLVESGVVHIFYKGCHNFCKVSVCTFDSASLMTEVKYWRSHRIDLAEAYKIIIASAHSVNVLASNFSNVKLIEIEMINTTQVSAIMARVGNGDIDPRMLELPSAALVSNFIRLSEYFLMFLKLMKLNTPPLPIKIGPTPI